MKRRLNDHPREEFRTHYGNLVMKRKAFRAKVRAKRIQNFCVEREITSLTHFTRVENLNGILGEGLLSREQLKHNDRDFHFNDCDRADTHLDSICLNVSFPNYKLFFRFRKGRTSEADESHWIVLLLDAKIMSELNCAFCNENAAANSVRCIPLENRKEFRALESLFEDKLYYGTREIVRQSLAIPNNYTTNPQAEILVFDRISPEYIKKIVFYDYTILSRWQSNTLVSTVVDKFYFKYRHDYSHWQFDISEAYDSDESKANVEDDMPFDDDDIPF